MGKWGFLFFSEKIAQLEAFKETLKDADEIAQVDETIALIKSKMDEVKA
ncbi:MAG: hypothetical protein IKU25_09475 [Clostridia bacterium]|nr:hypothetical protein [Clostridia bacterium]